jgi:hypothetical protein
MLIKVAGIQNIQVCMARNIYKVQLLILVNNQFDALFQCIYLFHFSTCFEQPTAHHQENQLYQYIIWYISLCVGGCLICRSGLAYQAVLIRGEQKLKNLPQVFLTMLVSFICGVLGAPTVFFSWLVTLLAH